MKFVVVFNNMPCHITMRAQRWLSIAGLKTCLKRVTCYFTMSAIQLVPFETTRCSVWFCRPHIPSSEQSNILAVMNSGENVPLPFLLLNVGKDFIHGVEVITSLLGLSCQNTSHVTPLGIVSPNPSSNDRKLSLDCHCYSQALDQILKAHPKQFLGSHNIYLQHHRLA